MLLLIFKFQHLSMFNLLSLLMEPWWQPEELRRNVVGVSELCCTVPDLQYTDATKRYDSYRRKSRKMWTLQGTKDNSILFTSHTSPVSVFLHQHGIKYTVGGQHRPFQWQHIPVFSWGCRCHHVRRKQDLHEKKYLILVYISCDSLEGPHINTQQLLPMREEFGIGMHELWSITEETCIRINQPPLIHRII